MLRSLRDMVLHRDISAVELVQCALDRITQRDPTLNAVVALRAEALADANALDERLRSGLAVGRLAGLPVLVKDVEDVEGLPTTYGSVLHAHDGPANADAHVPARLRAEGAIIVGKTNVPEFAREGYTSNPLFGATKNPWNTDWSPGGSSGGAAAALAAGMVPIATGTDGAGSIRVPSALCGLVGLKPSNGIVGRQPIPTWMDLSTEGPLGVSVDDVRLLLEIEAGAVPGDPTALPTWPLGPRPPFQRILATTRLCPGDPPTPSIQGLFENALRRLAEVLHLPVEVLEPASIFEGGNPDDDSLTIGGVEQIQFIGRNQLDSLADLLDPRFVSCMQDAARVSIDEYVAARRRRFTYARQIDELLQNNSLLVAPTVTVEGWTPDGRLPGSHDVGLPNAIVNTVAHNLTGHPSVSLPAGVGPHNIPFGLLLTSPRYWDDMLLDVAERWEEAYPWPLTAPGYSPFAPSKT